MALLEIFDRVRGRQIVELGETPLSVGRKREHADYVIEGDDAVSRLHVRFEPYPNGLGWTVEDQGSKNGTRVNGVDVYGKHKLANGDEIRVGTTTIVFRKADSDDGSTTKPKGKPPVVSTKELEVLVELCRPYYGNGRTKRAASRKLVAERLFVGEPAVQAHLTHLYDRFGIPEGSDGPDGKVRRDLLAEFAMDSGIIGLRHYDDADAPTGA
jgi:hypothetical protein